MAELQIIANKASSNTVAATIITANLTADSLLVAAVYFNGGTPAVSDPTNGSWTQIGSTLDGVNGLAGYHVAFFYKAHNASTAKPAITLSTGGAATSVGIYVIEFSPGTPTPGVPAFKNITGDGPSTDTVTPVVTGDPVVAMDVGSVTVGMLPVAPFNGDLTQNGNFGDNCAAWTVSTTGGTPIACTFGAAGSQDHMLGIVAFTGGVAAQQIRPDADIDKATWDTYPTGGNPLYAAIDEASAGNDVIRATAS